jgi:hypothetical protein
MQKAAGVRAHHVQCRTHTASQCLTDL